MSEARSGGPAGQEAAGISPPGRSALETSRQALQSGRDFIRILLEDSPAYFVALDRDYRVIEMNPAMLVATGYRAGEVIGWDYLERFCHPADRERLAAVFSRLRAQPVPGEGENRILTRDGEELAMEWQGRALRDEDGKLKFLFNLGRDVTLQRKALRALEESEHTFRSIVENAHAAMTISDEQGRFLYVNPQYCRLVERGPGELIGTLAEESLRGIFDPPTIEKLGSSRRRRLGGEAVPPRYTLSALYKGREIRWYEMRAVTIRGSGGESRVVAQLLDITGEVQAQRAIEQSEEKYRALFQSAPVGILSVDAEGGILEINRKMLEILGSPGEDATRAINLLRSPRLIRAGIAADFRRCLQSGEARILESPYTSAWGRRSHLRYHLTPLRRERERVVAVQAIVEDITEQKGLEQRLAHSQKMESLGTLSGGIAHEFNNLLQVIQGYAEILSLQQDLPPGRRQQVGEIQAAARRAAELTRQLLAFGRKLESDLEPVDLNQQVRGTMQLLRSGALREVEVELELGEPLRPVLADAAQLQQVLTNLALNSVEATARRVRIRTRDQSGEGLQSAAYQHLAFEDDGEGIDPGALKNVFDPFYTTKRVGEGAGLGLSVVYGIVHNHGGHIECRSSRGEGTTFDLYLPVAEVRQEIPAPGPEEPPAARPGGRILLVDDEPTLRRLGRDFLNGNGYQVQVAGDCEQALDWFRQRPAEVDLVILDLILPGKSGEWGLQEFLRLKPEQKVLVTSGLTLGATVGAMLSAGASGFIHKPYHLAELLATVREILGAAA
jgi:two-component system cell cycle sensor histidine kinase/response regulator CckA